MVKTNDDLRDWRTGLDPAPAPLLRRFLEPHPGVRGPYEMEGAINVLARTCLHLLARVEQLEGGGAVPDQGYVTPLEAHRQLLAALGGEGAKDPRAWKRAPIVLEGDDGDTPATGSMPAQRSPRVRLPDLIHALLSETPGRWWMPREIVGELQRRKQVDGTYNAVRISAACSICWLGRGWLRRDHPAWPQRRQYSLPAKAEVTS